ncbi:cyclin-dependent protein kinase inhibitor SMR13 [Brassica rapa]|uniref:Cyclin-dependent protein kinase inhibitor SMR13 n=1 Tax=Brassica campestris TaxID=3711 RepID=M4ER18_BRACM|nr:cyclin-dependent protein kinase inhibitor SMR13 [Brassica rapa]
MTSRKARKPNRAEKKLKRTHFKKKLPRHKNTDTPTILDHTSSSTIVSSCSSTTTTFSPEDTSYSVHSPSPKVLTSSPGKGGVGGGCCTPKSQKSRIPEILTCPPAPKKKRVPQNCTLRRRQIVFFAPPEIELFFVKANHQ